MRTLNWSHIEFFLWYYVFLSPDPLKCCLRKKKNSLIKWKFELKKRHGIGIRDVQQCYNAEVVKTSSKAFKTRKKVSNFKKFKEENKKRKSVHFCWCLMWTLKHVVHQQYLLGSNASAPPLEPPPGVLHANLSMYSSASKGSWRGREASECTDCFPSHRNKNHQNTRNDWRTLHLKVTRITCTGFTASVFFHCTRTVNHIDAIFLTLVYI